MPTTFGFNANTLRTQDYLLQTLLTPGNAPGVNDPSESSAIAPSQTIDFSGDVDVIAVTLIKGQVYTFDVDGGSGDASGGSVGSTSSTHAGTGSPPSATAIRWIAGRPTASTPVSPSP